MTEQLNVGGKNQGFDIKRTCVISFALFALFYEDLLFFLGIFTYLA